MNNFTHTFPSNSKLIEINLQWFVKKGDQEYLGPYASRHDAALCQQIDQALSQFDDEKVA